MDTTVFGRMINDQQYARDVAKRIFTPPQSNGVNVNFVLDPNALHEDLNGVHKKVMEQIETAMYRPEIELERPEVGSKRLLERTFALNNKNFIFKANAPGGGPNEGLLGQKDNYSLME